jgi:hypothetical protein
MILALSIALVSALGTNVSALFKARGTGLTTPPGDPRAWFRLLAGG